VVRPRGSGPGARVFPIAIAAGVLLLVVCGVFGFYALQKRDQPMAQMAVETPSPIGGPVSSPSPTPASNENAVVPDTRNDEVPAATPKKSPREEAKKTPERRPESPTPEREGEGHAGDVQVDPPDVPVPPNFDERNRPRRPRITSDGAVIRTLPDGSQLITMPNGMRVMITKDGKRQILNPPRPNIRRRPAPAPAPSPQ